MKGAGSLGEPRDRKHRTTGGRRSAACPAGAERAGGFQGVAVGGCLVSERAGGFQGVAVGGCLVSERAGGFQRGICSEHFV